MTRLISFSATWPQYLDGSKTVTRRMKEVWTDGEHFYSKRPKVEAERRGEFRKVIVPSWWNHAKGEPTLKPGEIFEGIEWIRVGPRYACDDCGWIGGKADAIPPSMGSGGKFRCQNKQCAAWSVVRRDPRRGVLSKHLETRIVRLGDDEGCVCDGAGATGINLTHFCNICGGGGSAAEAAREGFPGLSWQQFTDKCFPGIPPGSKVARVRFERIES